MVVSTDEARQAGRTPGKSLELTSNPSEWAQLCPRAGGLMGIDRHRSS